MNQIVYLLYSGTIHLQVKRDLKLTRLLTIISPFLAKYMKHNKSNTTSLHEIAIIFSSIYSLEATYLISSFNLRKKLKNLIPDAMIIP